MMTKKTKKTSKELNIKLSDLAYAQLLVLSDETGAENITQTIISSITLFKFIHEEMKKGAKPILHYKKSREFIEILFKEKWGKY